MHVPDAQLSAAQHSTPEKSVCRSSTASALHDFEVAGNLAVTSRRLHSNTLCAPEPVGVVIMEHCGVAADNCLVLWPQSFRFRMYKLFPSLLKGDAARTDRRKESARSSLLTLVGREPDTVILEIAASRWRGKSLR
ncbi:hypothetical protein INR49_001933 [Caranx melampygus]|nr:hypothetical protein INR49_001933 [Caranx melampygus]